MKIALAGGTGFVGDYLVTALLRRGHGVALLVRPGSESKVRDPDQCDIVTGDLEDENSLKRLFDGCDAAIYNVGILRENPRRGVTFERLQYRAVARYLDTAAAAGINRFLLMSANGVRPDGTPYQESKYKAEQAAFASGISATAFRPSVIFGDPRGKMEIATQLRNDMIRPPLPAVDFFVATGEHSGPVRMSPVHAADVADAFVAALDDSTTIGKSLELGGQEVLTWGEMIRRVAAACGRRKWLIPMPIEAMKLGAYCLDWLPVFPVTRDQLTMLAEGNTADPSTLRTLIRREPRAFSAAELAYLV